MKIAIHGADGDFSERWIEYCEKNHIDFQIVDCFDSKIIKTLENCMVLLWHWRWIQPESQIVARQIIASVEKMGILVYPNLDTCWHYDDKIGQKYLLEALGAPLITTDIFYSKEKALEFIKNADFPKVFKLRCGSASSNVRLARTRKEAERLCQKSFTSGFKPMGEFFADSKIKIKHTKDMSHFFQKIKRMPKFFIKYYYANRIIPRQIGYIYFQDFLPGNDFDTRITIVGDRAFGLIRHARKDDFRASGSGSVDYDHKKIDKRFLNIAFEITDKIGARTLAFDFLLDAFGEPKICEISYCLPSFRIFESEGYWDKNLAWHPGNYYIEDLIIQDILHEFQIKR